MSRDLIRLLGEALRYHQEQTRPIQRTIEALAAAEAHLAGDVEPTDERAAFDQFAKSRGHSTRLDRDAAWDLWQAARAWKPEPKKEPTP